jgi:uncharacterized protein YndB with AHSA1/START domain
MAREHPSMNPSSLQPGGRPRRPLRAPVAICVDACFEESPEHVFNAWLDRGVAGRWLFATATRPIARIAIDARVGGGFRFVERRREADVEHVGEYVEIVPYRRIVFTLSLADRRRAVTRVIVEIEERAIGCSLALTHENVPLDLAYGVEARWTGMLYGLGVTLDSIGGGLLAGRPPMARHGPLRRAALGEGHLS